jgi:NADPH:quinone reductase-like Zn-dependent oxidoreductase
MLATGTGALAELVAIPAQYAVRRPPRVRSADAAGALLPGMTAHELVAAAKLKPGDRVLVNAAAGGIGSLVTQMVRRAVGSEGHIVGVCGSKNQALARELGADEVIDYTLHPDLAGHLTTTFSSRPFAAIIDAIGIHALFAASPSYLRPDGVYSSVGVRPPDFSFPSFLRAVLRMKLNEYWPASSYLGGFGRAWHGVAVMAPTLGDRQRVMDLLAAGELRVVRDSIWAFGDVKEAYERLMTGHVSGKVLVKVNAELDDDA